MLSLFAFISLILKVVAWLAVSFILGLILMFLFTLIVKNPTYFKNFFSNESDNSDNHIKNIFSFEFWEKIFYKD